MLTLILLTYITGFIFTSVIAFIASNGRLYIKLPFAVITGAFWPAFIPVIANLYGCYFRYSKRGGE